MSMETYEDILGTAEIDLAIAESEVQIAEGTELLDVKDVFEAGRRKSKNIVTIQS